MASPDAAEAKKAAPERAFNNPVAREWTEALFDQHRAFYPDVTYSLAFTLAGTVADVD
ncbi:hypothetical protein ACIGJO_24595 [Streptomyces sp. NPDC079020]|uniref:hypothetical protein n=1 Tax=Streptomyces sp. NPDC079020 TaxID=3365722 RepID=UPI0037D04C3E